MAPLSRGVCECNHRCIVTITRHNRWKFWQEDHEVQLQFMELRGAMLAWHQPQKADPSLVLSVSSAGAELIRRRELLIPALRYLYNDLSHPTFRGELSILNFFPSSTVLNHPT